MDVQPIRFPDSTNYLRAMAACGGALRLVWTAIRMPVLSVLVVMEPVVCGVLSAIAVLGVLVALFFQFVVGLPDFPFGMMLGVSAGLAFLLVPYYLLIRLFSMR